MRVTKLIQKVATVHCLEPPKCVDATAPQLAPMHTACASLYFQLSLRPQGPSEPHARDGRRPAGPVAGSHHGAGLWRRHLTELTPFCTKDMTSLILLPPALASSASTAFFPLNMLGMFCSFFLVAGHRSCVFDGHAQ